MKQSHRKQHATEDTTTTWTPSEQAKKYARQFAAVCVQESKIALLERLAALINQTIEDNKVGA